MLKKIPNIISPGLMKVLMEMGHGDGIVLADGNFPAQSIAQGTPGGLVRADGHGVPELLEAILRFFPLDTYADEGESVALMQVVEGDRSVPPGGPEIWGRFRTIIEASDEGANFKDFQTIERFAFYERARKAFAVVATSETALYANIILKKGVVTG